MLRNRSKKALMSKNPTPPISSFLNSPRFFNGLLAKTLSDSETPLMSPTSILDTKNPSNSSNPFAYDKYFPKPRTPILEINPSSRKNQEPEGIGLALIDSLNEGKTGENFSKPINSMVLFGSNLKIQIPHMNSPVEFGTKTQFVSPFCGTPEKGFTRQLSLREMELSEEYTCVITHGPNPKKTHIFDDCVVESCCEDDEKLFGDNKMECGSDQTDISSSSSVNFLSFCGTCKDRFEEGKDIHIYRGERAFCSHECRDQEMLSEEMKNPEMDIDL